MTARLTPWFPADVKPVRVGLYRRSYAQGLISSPDYWDGNGWIVLTRDGRRMGASSFSLPWRGLASDPAVSK